MHSDEQERMDALSGAIVRLLRRQDDTDRRLAHIETALGITAAVPPVVRQPEPAPPAEPPQEPPPPVAAEPPTVAEQPAPLPSTDQPAPLPPLAAAPDRPREFETQVGLTWISRIGAVTLIFAAAFIFKYAIDNQWIGESGRVILGILGGLACAGAGDGMWSRGQQTYAQAISGLGIAILYLSFYASFAFYHLLPQSVPFALMTLTTALSVALALRYQAPSIAILGLIGGYLTPVLLSTGEDRPVIFFSYVFLLGMGALALVHARKWRVFEYLAFAATILLYSAWAVEYFNSEKQTVAAVFALLFYARFLVAGSAVIVLASQVLVTATLAGIWDTKPLAYLATTTAVGAAGLIAADFQKRAVLAPVALAAYWSLYAVWYHSVAGMAAIATALPLLTVGFLLFYFWPPWRVLVRKAELGAPEFLVLSLNPVAYFTASYNLLVIDNRAYLGLFTVALAGLYLAMGMEMWRWLPAEIRDSRPVLLALGVALTFLTLAAPIQFTGYRITIGWAGEAAALTWIGKRAGSGRISVAAIGIFALVVIRLWLIDSWMHLRPDYVALGNSRFLTFLIAAAAFFGSSYWLGAGARTRALTTYIAGHVVLLWGLGLEVTGWAKRTAAPLNLESLESTSISILMAVYALALVVAGVLTRTLINRVIGLGLIGLVVVKLYLYDVWLLVRIYRIAAFAALGALLLITSYLYSRYRTKIEAWWKDDQAAS
jgi:uncharacterized membrane protein